MLHRAPICALFLVSCLTATAETRLLDLPQLLQKMVAAQQRNRAAMRSYVLTRQYHVYKGDEQKSEMVAMISYTPPQAKTFVIEQSTGGMAEKVVRKALEKEVELTKDPTVTELSATNYVFTLTGTQLLDGRTCYVLTMKPRRESKDLLEGRVWVDGETFLVRRIEGSPSKSSSWWVKSLDLVLTYGEHDGMWMQIGSRADAHIRMAGAYRMVSRDVELRSATLTAQRTRPVMPVTLGAYYGASANRQK